MLTKKKHNFDQLYYSLKCNTNKETVLITVLMVSHYTLCRNQKKNLKKAKLNKVIRQFFFKGKNKR